jgi:hypothetical protein
MIHNIPGSLPSGFHRNSVAAIQSTTWTLVIMFLTNERLWCGISSDVMYFKPIHKPFWQEGSRNSSYLAMRRIT